MKRGVRREYELMPIRVRDVLLVSSLYDAFVLEEDGHISEQVFMEYKSLSLSSAPRFTHVTTWSSAFEMLDKRHFDLVLVVARQASTGLIEFGKQVRSRYPKQPVVILGFATMDAPRLRKLVGTDVMDALFMWNGDAKILLAIIKHIEDRLNLDNDIEVAGVRVILVVEDSVKHYSSFLSTLYPELMKQSQSLFAEGLNRLQKLLKMRTRPKIIHAMTYEDALGLFERYRDNVIGVVSDVGFPRNGEMDPTAGLLLARKIRKCSQDMPILLQSAEAELAEEASKLGVLFVDKSSPELLGTVRRFLVNYLGFGPFIFRSPDGVEVARAGDIRELVQCIATVPAESLEYHARRNHFSNWIRARSEFELADRLKVARVDDFDSVEAIRGHLIQTFDAYLARSRRGVITDFSAQSFDPEAVFNRIGEGSLGGKARGIAFLDHILNVESDRGVIEGLRMEIPQTFVLATEPYEELIQTGNLYGAVASESTDEEIIERFVSASLPGALKADLRVILQRVVRPLAVRSSSLLEDDMSHPFAGIYGTVMIPNRDPDSEKRLSDLECAIKVVYATAFLRNARAYLENTGHSIEQERMAVVIQPVVGQRYGSRYYPHFSGVAHSFNYYPIGHQRNEQGVVQMVLGLGRLVVDGGTALRFCPRYPEVIPQFASPSSVLRTTQRSFYGLDLSLDWFDRRAGFQGNQRLYELKAAEKDGSFKAVGSYYDAQNDVISDGAAAQGPLVVTFNNILKYNAIPLAPALDRLLSILSDGMGTQVELEFAGDMGDWGRTQSRGQEKRVPTLFPLQVRPIVTPVSSSDLEIEDYPEESVICRSTEALGHGHMASLHDIVYVRHDRFNPARSPAIARELGLINKKISQERRSYILMGPGRWGSSDHWLGIPVQWADISGAKVIVEASPEDYNVDPSQGSHFFHNITALGLGYFTIPPGAVRERPMKESFVDWKLLDAMEAAEETEHLRHIRVEPGLVAQMDGRRGLGIVAVSSAAVSP